MANDQQRTDDTDEGLSRRQVLARGAVAAGIVWAAPVIRSASAYATSAAGTERPCSKFYLVCIDQLGARPVRFIDDSKGYDEMPSDAVIARFRPIPGPAPTSTTTSSTSTTTTSSTSSTTTSSTSSTTTSSTSTTTTTKPFKDPTKGLGLFPGDEATADPRNVKKNKNKDKNKNKTRSRRPPRRTRTPIPAPRSHRRWTRTRRRSTIWVSSRTRTRRFRRRPTTVVPAFDTLPPGIDKWLTDNPDVPVRYPEVPPMLTQTGDEAWAVLLPAVQGGPNPDTHQCRAVKGWSHAATKYAEFYVDANLVGTDEENLRLIFPSPTMDDGNPGAIENLFLVYCCP